MTLVGPAWLANGSLWRVFPWDETAPDGEPYSCRSVAPARLQNYGRFDLRGKPLVLYLGETAEHAVTEALRGLLRDPGRDPVFRHSITDADLFSGGHRRALVEVRLPTSALDCLPDLCDGGMLHRYGVRADELSSSDRALSRRSARKIYDYADHPPGFAWWSRFGGDWHVVLLFLDRVLLSELDFGRPVALDLKHPAVHRAAEVLHVDIAPLPPT